MKKNVLVDLEMVNYQNVKNETNLMYNETAKKRERSSRFSLLF